MTKTKKRWSQMTAEELHEATKQYDRPFVALQESRPMTPKERLAYRKQLHHGRRASQGEAARRVLIRLEGGLLKRADAYARRHGITRSELIARGLEVMITSAA